MSCIKGMFASGLLLFSVLSGPASADTGTIETLWSKTIVTRPQGDAGVHFPVKVGDDGKTYVFMNERGNAIEMLELGIDGSTLSRLNVISYSDKKWLDGVITSDGELVYFFDTGNSLTMETFRKKGTEWKRVFSRKLALEGSFETGLATLGHNDMFLITRFDDESFLVSADGEKVVHIEMPKRYVGKFKSMEKSNRGYIGVGTEGGIFEFDKDGQFRLLVSVPDSSLSMYGHAYVVNDGYVISEYRSVKAYDSLGQHRGTLTEPSKFQFTSGSYVYGTQVGNNNDIVFTRALPNLGEAAQLSYPVTATQTESHYANGGNEVTIGYFDYSDNKPKREFKVERLKLNFGT